MKPIKVLEIISGFAVEGPLGGIERFGIELSQSFDSAVVEPVLCGMWAYDTPYEYEWVDYLRSKNISAFIVADWDESSPYQSFLKVYKQLGNFVEEVDIIHSHCQFGDVLALLFQRKLGAKAVVRTVHNEKEWAKRPLRRQLLTNIMYPVLFDLELGVAQKVVDNLNQRWLSRIVKQSVVKSYNALNFNRFDSAQIDIVAKKSSLGIDPNQRVVGTVGRLSEQKGYTYLLDAIALLAAKQHDLIFLIIGNGHLQAELEAKAVKLGLNNVIFTGARNDVEELLQIMDVFVNSSLWEGLPTVVMESMAARVPVVATNVGGNKELITHGETGWLVPPMNVDELANAIDGVLQMAYEQKAIICENAFAHTEKKFSISAVARQYEQLYLRLLQGS
jgi:glycosyltransferase involved in cell wall biosynthesis